MSKVQLIELLGVKIAVVTFIKIQPFLIVYDMYSVKKRM